MFGELLAGDVIGKFIYAHKIDKWARLVLEMGLSYWLTFSAVCGAALAGTGAFGLQRPSVAIGLGMVAAAGACYRTYILSDLTKGMTVTVAQGALQDDSGLQTTSKK